MAIATQEFIKQIDELTVLELNGLVKALEEHYGVSAAAAAVAAPAGGGAAAAPPPQEQTEVDEGLQAAGDKKINDTKAVREGTRLRVQEAQETVQTPPPTGQERRF